MPVERFYDATASVFPQHVVAGGAVVAVETIDVLNETAKAAITTAIAALTIAVVNRERRFCGRRQNALRIFERALFM
ncbi:hypothetical protein A1D31_38525 [Bradyrhizobium liaoningense]|nr:hypothetical protein A1D31_38525 [Bradyrhizobium liaoningense]